MANSERDERTSGLLPVDPALRGPVFVPRCAVDDDALFRNGRVSLLYYDVETTGLDVWHDRIVQFAAVRRDLITGQEVSEFVRLCKPLPDNLPSPAATATHGISEEYAEKHGIPEPELADLVRRGMSRPGSVAVGFNSTGFDSVLVRALLYRNFHDPYRHEWDNGCARWDLLPVVRTFLALAPGALPWVPREGGGASLTLVDLADAARIDYPNAHNALEDTRTLEALDAALRQRSEALWRAAFSRRRPDLVTRDIGPAWDPHLMLYVTRFVPAVERCVAAVAPVVAHPSQGKRGLVWDLRHDPGCLVGLGVEEIADRLFVRGEQRLPVFRVATNANPQIFPLTVEDAQRLLTPARIDAVKENLRRLREMHHDVAPKLRQALTLRDEQGDPQAPPDRDVDEALYDGFPDEEGLRRVNQARAKGPAALAQLMRHGKFADWRTSRLLWRYVARHHGDQLTADEQRRWNAEAAARLEQQRRGHEAEAASTREAEARMADQSR